MRQNTLAPWAEPVPDAPYPLTAADALDGLDVIPGFIHLVSDLFSLKPAFIPRPKGRGMKAGSPAGDDRTANGRL